MAGVHHDYEWNDINGDNLIEPKELERRVKDSKEPIELDPTTHLCDACGGTGVPGATAQDKHTLCGKCPGSMGLRKEYYHLPHHDIRYLEAQKLRLDGLGFGKTRGPASNGEGPVRRVETDIRREKEGLEHLNRFGTSGKRLAQLALPDFDKISVEITRCNNVANQLYEARLNKGDFSDSQLEQVNAYFKDKGETELTCVNNVLTVYVRRDILVSDRDYEEMEEALEHGATMEGFGQGKQSRPIRRDKASGGDSVGDSTANAEAMQKSLADQAKLARLTEKIAEKREKISQMESDVETMKKQGMSMDFTTPQAQKLAKKIASKRSAIARNKKDIKPLLVKQRQAAYEAKSANHDVAAFEERRRLVMVCSTASTPAGCLSLPDLSPNVSFLLAILPLLYLFYALVARRSRAPKRPRNSRTCLHASNPDGIYMYEPVEPYFDFA